MEALWSITDALLGLSVTKAEELASGLMRCSKLHNYSITSSARASSDTAR
jgi:hypothetical protein